MTSSTVTRDRNHSATVRWLATATWTQIPQYLLAIYGFFLYSFPVSSSKDSAAAAAFSGGSGGGGGAQQTVTLPAMTEYCRWETFNASCEHSDSVVLMLEARYGRMKLGRCADTDVYIGCSADVLPSMDARCSGRESCAVKIPDGSLHQQQPCPGDMMAYLEASFTCVPVVGLNKEVVEICNSEPLQPSSSGSSVNYITVNLDDKSSSSSSTAAGASASKFLSSYVAASHHYGTSRCPWLIQVPSGQRIELTLFDFSLTTRYRFKGSTAWKNGDPSIVEPAPLGDPTYCHVYATVTELGRTSSVSSVRHNHESGRSGLTSVMLNSDVGGDRTAGHTICAEDRRETRVYTSLTNKLVVELPQHIVEDPSVNFLLRFTAVGCADVPAPSNAWVQRVNDRVTISCNHTSHTWHLVCKGNTWIGRASDCESGSPSEERLQTGSPFPAYGLILAVLTGVVVGSLCGFSLLAAILWCKRRTELNIMRETQHAYDVELVAPSGESYGVTGTASSYYKSGVVSSRQSADYAYTHVWQPGMTTLASHDTTFPEDGGHVTGGQPVDLLGIYDTRGRSPFAQRLPQQPTSKQTGDRGATGIPGGGASVTGEGLCRHVVMCRDHLYESPAIDDTSLSKNATVGGIQWSPYYWHGATPCMLVSRGTNNGQYELGRQQQLQQQQQHPSHYQFQQQQQQPAMTAGFKLGSTPIPVPPPNLLTNLSGSTVVETGTGTDANGSSPVSESQAVLASSSTDAINASSLAEVSQKQPTSSTGSKTSAIAPTAAYEPVTCQHRPPPPPAVMPAAADQPDITSSKPTTRSENHYT